MFFSSSSRVVAVLAACMASVLTLALASVAQATHARPKAATPLFTSFVVAYDQCGGPAGPPPNANHGPAFSFDSCAPPRPSSRWLTVGTPDNNSNSSNAVASSRLVVEASPADIRADVSIRDVRCTAALASANPTACPSGALGEYIGSVAVMYALRITDHCNAPNIAVPPECPVPAPGDPLAATVVDFRFPIVVACLPPALLTGSNCVLSTSFNAIVGGPPFAINAGTRANIRTADPHVIDGGPDADARTEDNQRFLEEGVFVP